MADARIKLHVVPRSSRNEVVLRDDGSFALKLTAPPVEGAANKAAIDYLAQCLGVRKSQVSLVSGEKSRDKTFEVAGLSVPEIRDRLTHNAD